MVFVRIGTLQAIQRHEVWVFNLDQKDHRGGNRKRNQ
jgi:hypothetical protein